MKGFNMEKGVTKIYRLMRFFYLKRVPILPKLIKLIIRVVYSCTIPYTVQIGHGTKFPHGGQGVILHEETVIGDNCKIQANVVIGGRNNKPGAPQIGNNVLIGAGAVLLGNIKIGNHVAIGANSVVTSDIPNNAVVTGIPGKVSRYLDEDENIM